MLRIVRFRVGVLLIAVIVVASSGCTSSRSSAASASNDPPTSVRHFCGVRGRDEIATSLGVTAIRVTRPSASGHAYSCRFVYPNGAIRISVTRYPSSGAAARAQRDVERQRGRRPEQPQLGESLHAVVTTDGSVVVRRARDVLDVDVAALPDRFGAPPQSPSVIARAVAVTIIGHWVPG
jgi:hypothetical protein